MSLHMGDSRAGPAGGNNYSRPEGQNVRTSARGCKVHHGSLLGSLRAFYRSFTAEGRMQWPLCEHRFSPLLFHCTPLPSCTMRARSPAARGTAAQQGRYVMVSVFPANAGGQLHDRAQLVPRAGAPRRRLPDHIRLKALLRSHCSAYWTPGGAHLVARSLCPCSYEVVRAACLNVACMGPIPNVIHGGNPWHTEDIAQLLAVHTIMCGSWEGTLLMHVKCTM